MAKICIDAGHGGRDSGALGPTGLKESDVNLELSHAIARQLQHLGHEVFLSRPRDEFVDINERCRLANGFLADYFCSIHCNSYHLPSAVGIETLYKSEAGKSLSAPIQKALIAATGDVDRGLKHRTNLGVLNGTQMPATLVEVGFISHPATETKLNTFEYKAAIIDAIVKGLVETAGEPGRIIA